MPKVSKKSNKSAEKSKKRDEESESENDEATEPETADEEKANALSEKTEDNGADDKDKPEEDEEDDADYEYEEDEHYVPRKVLDHKIERGVSFYLIRWKGYGKKDDTWENEHTIVKDAIVAYKKLQDNSKNSNKKPAPKSRTKQGGSSKNIKRDNNKETKKASPKGKKRNAPSDVGEEYDVEKIIDVGDDSNGERVFRLRWKGFPASEDTWEPESHLTCDALIQKFFRDLKKSKKSGSGERKELRENRKTPERSRAAGQIKEKSSRRLHGKVRKVYYDSK